MELQLPRLSFEHLGLLIALFATLTGSVVPAASLSTISMYVITYVSKDFHAMRV
jgi:hypothetical protein